MIDIQNPLNGYILKNLPVPDGSISVITNDLFLDDCGLALCCAPSPSNAYERKHNDGTVMGKRFYDYRCRSANAAEARMVLELLLELVDERSLQVYEGTAYESDDEDLDGLEVSFMDCEAVSAPVFLGVDEKGQSVYQCGISVSYYN